MWKLDDRVKVSIVVPFHWMGGWPYYLERCLRSIEMQSFKDYEVILMKVGSMPVTSNRVIQGAKGEIIKVLYMDDYFAHEDSLQAIVDKYPFKWLVSECDHNDGGSDNFNKHFPIFDAGKIMGGINTIGSPSVLAFENNGKILFDEKLSWMLDCDLYIRLYQEYGEPVILNDVNVTIGLHSGQTTYALSNEQKEEEVNYVIKKYS